MNYGSQDIQQEGRQRQNSNETSGSAIESCASQKEALAEEEWRPVVGYEGFYEVSNMGQIRSLSRLVVGGNGARKFQVGRVLSQSRTGKTAKRGAGYMAAKLSVHGTGKLTKVHREVAIAFIPNPLGLPQVNHKDTNTFNNRAGNLEWVTNAGNIQHASRNGLLRPQRGERCVTHKLTEQEVMEIRSIKGIGQRVIAKRFGVGKTQIARIQQGVSWAHSI